MEIPGNCADTTDPICDFLPEKEAGSRIIQGGLQVFAWSLSTGYACDNTPEPGQILEPPTPPNIIAECPAIHGSIWVEGDCVHTCQTDYTKNGDACEPTCEVSWPEECGSRQRSIRISECTDSFRYECENCVYGKNEKALDWTAENHHICRKEDCAPHHYSETDGECVPCPVNTQRPAGDASCSACPAWTHTTTSGEACIDCFTPPNTVAQCPEGMQRVSDVNTIETYFVDQDTRYLDNDLFCEQNYACLPCKPGSFLSDSETCDACAPGTYQPNYAATSCFNGALYSTSEAGSTDLSDCVCTQGHE